MNKRTIAVLSGIRSEYDILYPVLKAMSKHQGLDAKVIVTGAHCSDLHGRSERLIEADGFVIADRIESLLASNTAGARIRSAGIQIVGLVQTLEKLRPDFILVAGDREEAMTGALCGAYMNIPVAHMCGGDYVIGNVDDSVRHAVTKLAHLHFPMSIQSRDRLERMGEEPWRIHCTGNPAIDRLMDEPAIEPLELSRLLDFDVTRNPLLLVIQHVISSEISEAHQQMSVTIDALAELSIPTVIIYPNSDAGSKDIIRAINDRLPGLPWVKAYRNLPRNQFVNLLRRVDCLVGNSSMGILEAPSLRLPVVNIGSRQKGREHAGNVLFVPHDSAAIVQAVNMALHDGEFREKIKKCENPFGGGSSGQKIADILAGVEINGRLLRKEWTF